MTLLIITEEILPTIIHTAQAAKHAVGFWQREHNKIHENANDIKSLEAAIQQAQHVMRMDCHAESWPRVDSKIVLLLANFALTDMENEQPVRPDALHQQQAIREQLWRAVAWAKSAAPPVKRPTLGTIGHFSNSRATMVSAIQTVIKKQ